NNYDVFKGVIRRLRTKGLEQVIPNDLVFSQHVTNSRCVQVFPRQQQKCKKQRDGAGKTPNARPLYQPSTHLTSVVSHFLETFTSLYGLQNRAIQYFPTSIGLNSHHKGSAICTPDTPKSRVFRIPFCPDTPVECRFPDASFAHIVA